MNQKSEIEVIKCCLRPERAAHNSPGQRPGYYSESEFAPCKGNSNVSKEGLSCPFRAPVTAHDTYPERCPGLLWAALTGRKQHILLRMRVQGFHVLGLLSSRKVISESSDLSVYFTKKLLLKIFNLEMKRTKVRVEIPAFYLRFCERLPFGVRKDTF
jgi:hypothetical protein